jgi:hypothetical protein
MSIINFTSLDFEDIKTLIKDYIRSNSNFTDYDFEGSNLSTIIDILSYNTYISSYNANMAANEVFIDSATLRENVVALARNIGYVPRSRQSSIANISFFSDVSNIDVNPPLTVSLQQGIVCTTNTSFNNQNFIFSIPENITVPVTDGIAIFDNVIVYEGTFIEESFIVDSTQSNQKFILSNPNIDTNSIRVSVKENENSPITVEYKISDNIIGIDENSRIFFIQEVEDQRYELIFGDGIFGKKLSSSNIINVSYIITNGEDANGISGFSFSGRLIDNNNNIVSNSASLITTISESRNGKEVESVSSIKKFAPRLYSSQNRAVTSRDYESIIPKIYAQTESVSVFGGEELDPPKYGKVFITIKPITGNFLSSGIKQNIKNELKKYSVSGIVPEIIDLKYLYLEIFSDIYYNPNLARDFNFVKNLIIKNIDNFSKSSELNQYGARFKYSKFLNLIDNSDKSITSNITSIQMRRDLRPVINRFADYEICFGNSFHVKNTNGYNIKTSGFIIDGLSDFVYLSDIPDKNKKTGKLFLFKLMSDDTPVIVRRSVGIIDYKKGEILVNPIKITSSAKIKNNTPVIEISASPNSNDVIGKQELYLRLDSNDVQINMLEDTIESGSDLSGSLFKLSSSYLNGELIRK